MCSWRSVRALQAVKVRWLERSTRQRKMGCVKPRRLALKGVISSAYRIHSRNYRSRNRLLLILLQ